MAFGGISARSCEWHSKVRQTDKHLIMIISCCSLFVQPLFFKHAKSQEALLTVFQEIPFSEEKSHSISFFIPSLFFLSSFQELANCVQGFDDS
jgi:hypothetical protein